MRIGKVEYTVLAEKARDMVLFMILRATVRAKDFVDGTADTVFTPITKELRELTRRSI